MFVHNIKAIAVNLISEYEKITKIINHSGVQGTVREDILKSYIKKIIPGKYSISQGIIINSDFSFR